jgi:hypothetical protein
LARTSSPDRKFSTPMYAFAAIACQSGARSGLSGLLNGEKTMTSWP